MNLPKRLERYANKILNLCEQFKVERLYVFGSVNSVDFNENTSDIDLIVELSPMPALEKGESLLNLWTEFEALFGRKVDMLTDQTIKNPIFRKRVERTKKLVYDRRSN